MTLHTCPRPGCPLLIATPAALPAVIFHQYQAVTSGILQACANQGLLCRLVLELDKLSVATTKEQEEHKKAVIELEAQLNDTDHELTKVVEALAVTRQQRDTAQEQLEREVASLAQANHTIKLQHVAAKSLGVLYVMQLHSMGRQGKSKEKEYTDKVKQLEGEGLKLVSNWRVRTSSGSPISTCAQSC